MRRCELRLPHSRSLPPPVVPAHGVDYDFASISSIGAALPQFTATVPSVNSAERPPSQTWCSTPSITATNTSSSGAMAPGELLPVANLTDALGVGSPSSLVINDAGAIAVNYSLGGQAAIVRNQRRRLVHRAGSGRPIGSAPYLEFPTTISMNGAGQVAALVTEFGLTSSIVRLDDSGDRRSRAALPSCPTSAVPRSTIRESWPSRLRRSLPLT